MIFPESFRKLERRAQDLLETYRRRPMSDSELDDKLIDLCVDNRCERLEELCPERGTLDQASAGPVLIRLAVQSREEGLPNRSLDTVAVPEGGKYSLVVGMASPRHPMKATHPSLTCVMLPHGDLERAMPFEFRARLRGEAAQKRFTERLGLALQDKVEELSFLFPRHLPSRSVYTPIAPQQSSVTVPAESIDIPNEPVAEASHITEPPVVAQPAEEAGGPSCTIDDQIEATITAAQNSDDPPLTFRKLLRLTDWRPRAWADAAVCSEPTISRWIHGKPVPRSNDAIRKALHQRLREYWPKVSEITFENLKPPLKN